MSEIPHHHHTHMHRGNGDGAQGPCPAVTWQCLQEKTEILIV